MNKLLFIYMVFGILLIAGCAGKKNPQDMAVDLVQNTPEGSFVIELKKGFSSTSQCTLEEYESKISAFSPLMEQYGLELKADSEDVLAETKLCDPQINEVIKYSENGKYIVSYSIETSPKCQLDNVRALSKDPFLEIEADILNAKATVIKGMFRGQEAETANQIKLFLPLAGNCLAPLLVATDYLSETVGTSAPTSPQPSAPLLQCSDGDECIVDLRGCKESDKAQAWKNKNELEGKIIYGSYGDKSGQLCNIESMTQAWPLEKTGDWWCGDVVSCNPSPQPLKCKENQKCVVDLTECSESQKAQAWKGMGKLDGIIAIKGYLDKSGEMCDVQSVTQAWPVNKESSWWCGDVTSCSD